jgi:methyltransferase (TIGR00027 family)
MKAGKASATARVIAAATVMCAHDATTSDLVAPGAARWCEEFLSMSKADRWLQASGKSAACRGAWRLLERSTHPGIVRHWMMRKRWIELRVRAAIAGGASQLVVLGAGFDTLGVRLAVERPDFRVVEIDHPATLAVKRSVVERIRGCSRPVMAESDFARNDENQSVLPPGAIDRGRRTVFVAEGLLMYLPEARVRSLLGELATATEQASQLVFSFMVERESGEIGFEPRSAMVSFWLAMKGEPFRWSLNSARAVAFAQELGWEVTAHADSVLLSGLAGIADGDRVIARGEEVIEAITIDSSGISAEG